MFLAATLKALLLAATMVPQSVEQLTDRATLVVRARVGDRHAESAPGPAGIYTFTQLTVLETLKGRATETVTLRQAGGAVGDRKVTLPGDASFAPGEEVLVFLVCRSGTDTCSLVALSEGKFHVVRGAAGPAQVTRDFHDVAFVRGPALSPGPEDYAVLAQRIRQRAEAAQ
jgi:hypothetical protein